MIKPSSFTDKQLLEMSSDDDSLASLVRSIKDWTQENYRAFRKAAKAFLKKPLNKFYHPWESQRIARLSVLTKDQRTGTS